MVLIYLEFPIELLRRNNILVETQYKADYKSASGSFRTANPKEQLTNHINQHYQMQWNKGLIFVVSILIMIFLKSIGWIPFLGWLIMLLISAGFFGAFIVSLFDKKALSNE